MGADNQWLRLVQFDNIPCFYFDLCTDALRQSNAASDVGLFKIVERSNVSTSVWVEILPTIIFLSLSWSL